MLVRPHIEAHSWAEAQRWGEQIQPPNVLLQEEPRSRDGTPRPRLPAVHPLLAHLAFPAVPPRGIRENEITHLPPSFFFVQLMR